MSINYEEILAEANKRYVELKTNKGGDFRYLAPEQLPMIQSDQVKAVLMVLVDVLNKGLDFSRVPDMEDGVMRVKLCQSPKTGEPYLE